MATTAAKPMLANGRVSVTCKQPQFLIPEIGRPWPFHIMVEPGGKWGVSEATIDPTLAAALLAYNRKNNRKQRPIAIERFSRDMIENRWRFTHEGIAFNTIAELVDGQHRLTCCINTGITFTTLVFFGFDEMEVVNTGTTRDATAAATIAGMDANKNDMSTLRNFLMGSTNYFSAFTNSEMLHKARVYAEVMAWCREVFKSTASSTRIISGPVRGAIARAYYHAPADKLIRFVDVLKLDTPAVEPGDRSAISLRNALEVGQLGGQAGRRDSFCKTQRAVQAFLGGEDLKLIRPVEADLFPLPSSERLDQVVN